MRITYSNNKTQPFHSTLIDIVAKTVVTTLATIAAGAAVSAVANMVSPAKKVP